MHNPRGWGVGEREDAGQLATYWHCCQLIRQQYRSVMQSRAGSFFHHPLLPRVVPIVKARAQVDRLHMHAANGTGPMCEVCGCAMFLLDEMLVKPTACITTFYRYCWQVSGCQSSVSCRTIEVCRVVDHVARTSACVYQLTKLVASKALHALLAYVGLVVCSRTTYYITTTADC
jgi:hypothetical protein